MPPRVHIHNDDNTSIQIDVETISFMDIKAFLSMYHDLPIKPHI